MSYAQQPIDQFLAAIGDRTPAPASGSALAVAAALAAALCELSARFADDAPAAEEAQHLRERLLALADEDAEAYAEFMRTKSDEARSRTIGVPLELAETSAAVARIAGRLERDGNPSLAGDAAAAAVLAGAVVRGAARLAQINLEQRIRRLLA